MIIHFKCHVCNAKFKVRPERSGQEVVCKYCGNKIMVPSQSGSDVKKFHATTKEKSFLEKMQQTFSKLLKRV